MRLDQNRRPADRAARRSAARAAGRTARRASRVLLLLAAAGQLSACAEMEARRQSDQDLKQAASLARVAEAPMPFADLRQVKVVDGIYVGATAHQMSRNRQLPAEWRSRTVSLVTPKPLDFREIATLISSSTGMPVSFASAMPKGGAPAPTSAPVVQRAPTLAAGGPNPPGFSMAEAQAMAGRAGGYGGQGYRAPEPDPVMSTDTSIPAGKMRVDYTGPLGPFLDQVADNYGVSWMADGGRVIFSQFDTRVFDVPALPIVLKLTSSVSDSDVAGGASGSSGGGGGGSSAGSSSDTVTSTSAYELWKDINASLKSIVGNGQGGVEVSGTTGTVTVTGTPDTIAHVASYVSELNRRIDKEVVLQITIYSVTLSESDDYGFDVNAVFSNGKLGSSFGGSSSVGSAFGSAAAAAATGLASSAAGAATGTGSTATSAAASGSAATTSTSSGTSTNGAGFTVVDPKSRFAGSSGIFKALSTSGRVSIVSSQSVTTVNGVPAPFNDTNLRSYVSSVSTAALSGAATTGATTVPQTSLNTSSITTGLALHLTPHVNPNGTVLVEYALDMSELNGAQNGFDSYTTGGQTVQTLNVNRRKSNQEAIIPSGSTLVMSGVERTRLDSSRSGTGSSDFPLLGGGRTGGLQREIMVIAITPQIIDLGSGRASR